MRLTNLQYNNIGIEIRREGTTDRWLFLIFIPMFKLYIFLYSRWRDGKTDRWTDREINPVWAGLPIGSSRLISVWGTGLMRRTMIAQVMTSSYVTKFNWTFKPPYASCSIIWLAPKCIIIFSFVAKVLLHQLCFIVSLIITLPPPPPCYPQAATTFTGTTPPPLPLALPSCRCRHQAAAVAVIYIARYVW